MKKADIVEFYARLAEANPHPETELEFVNAYTLLVAVALSAQSTDAGVNKATRALFRIADTPEKMVALGLDGLNEHIKTIGLYNTKAKNVIALSQMLIEHHGGEVPADRDALAVQRGRDDALGRGPHVAQAQRIAPPGSRVHLATGPDGRPGSISDCITTLILGADRRVTITTPYYVPDQPLDRAIRAAALRGVEVTMIVPARNDSLLVGATSEGFFGGLIEDGVQLWRFRPGLLHAKIVTVDGRMAMIGSANLDRRSFELNYEMNLMIVDQAVVADLDARQASYVARADRLDGPGIARWPVWRQVRNNLLAIASPVL